MTAQILETQTTLVNGRLQFSWNADDAGFEKAICLAETSMCPVWAMLKGNVEIVENHLLIKV
jgi:uncharacterized OsmC-like protein